MSAIAGVIRHASQSPQVLETQVLEVQDSLRAMTSALAHRGPDGVGHWADEEAGVALGHLALHSTPEALGETIPLRDEEHDLVLTCDARIDNREELGRELGLQVLEGVGDSDLILASYRKWGSDCARHLLGDFAFALWDGEKQELYCARDHVGVKPFYFFRSDEMFAFATEIKALLELTEVPREVNQEHVAEYLMGAFSSHQATSFRDISRLPGAHTLVVSPREVGAELQVKRYWDLREVPMQRGLCDREYEEKFRDVLFDAVRCRMRAPQSANGKSTLGAFLSGGMDSSSIVCVAREIRCAQSGQESDREAGEELPVFSAVYDDVPECDERPWMDAVIAMGGLEPHWLRGEDESPLLNLEEVLSYTDEPILGLNLCASWSHYGPVREAGVRVILDGHGGDETVGHGYALLNELVSARRWRDLWRELRLYERHGFRTSQPSWRTMWTALAHEVAPLRLAVRVVHGVGRRLPKTSRMLDGTRKRDGQNLAKNLANGEGTEGDEGADQAPWKLLSPTFAARIGAREMHGKWQAEQPRNFQGDRKVTEGLLGGPMQELALEELNKMAASAGLEVRYPLWDKRLVELCLSLPVEQKRRDGWSRSILRRALQGVLPDKVQWRASKNNFLPAASLGLRRHEADRLSRLAQGDVGAGAELVNGPEIARSARRVLDDKASTKDLQILVHAASLAAWLQVLEGASEEPQDIQKERYLEAQQMTG